jgi:hypothetical protein
MKNFKYTNIVTAIVLTIVASCFMAGCLKEENESSSPYCDFENPYEYVGKYHNEALTYILPKMDNHLRLKSSITNIENDAYTLTREFHETRPLQGNVFSFPKEVCDASLQTVKRIQLKSSEGQLSPNIAYYYQKFRSILANSKNYSLARVLNEFRIVEKEIYESAIDNVDKEILLIGYAVGKNSLEFWSFYNNKTIRLKTGGETSSSGANTSGANYVVDSDVLGGISGAMTGGYLGVAVGTLVGPPGTITGAITGAVGGGVLGAISSSVTAGVHYYASN